MVARFYLLLFHSQTMIFRLLQALTLCVLAASTNAWGRSSSEIQSDLRAITDKIQSLDQKNAKQQGALEKLETQLEKLEREISTTAKTRLTLQQELKEEQQKLKSITTKQLASQESLQHHQQLLAGHSRALHRISMKPGHELLDPHALQLNGRQHAWFGYLQQARQRSISALKIEHLELVSLASERQLTLERLSELEQGIEDQMLKLAAKKKQRKTTVANLATQLKTTRQEITQLQKNQSKLNKILKELQKTLADPAFSVQGKTAFSKLKGKLPWPVKGRISTQNDGVGLQINVSAGRPVHAISHGRVVFADWLRGFGLLTIIDHGEGYMSLYGHNESLFKQVGDWVEPGAVIGNTGSSGGRNKSGLYFELRHNNNTLSAKKWCKNTG